VGKFVFGILKCYNINSTIF